MITLAKITQYIEDREDVAEGATWYNNEDSLYLDSYEILSPFYTAKLDSFSDVLDWLNEQEITQECYIALTNTVDTQALYYAIKALYGERFGQNPTTD